MLRKYLRNSNFSSLKQSVEDGENCSVFGLNIGEKLALIEDSAFVFYVVPNVESISEVFDKLSDLGRRAWILKDFITPLSSEFESCHEVLEVLYQIKGGNIDTLIVTPEVLSAKFPLLDSLKKVEILRGQVLDVSKFAKELVEMGYKRVELVANKGEFAVRGDVLDIFPLCGSPTRIMTDFDIVDSIRTYNPLTLLTTSEIEAVSIEVMSYYNVSLHDVEKYYSDNNFRKDDVFYDLTSFDRVDYRLVAIDANVSASICDFVRDPIIVFDGAKNIYDNLEKYVVNFNESIEKSDCGKVLMSCKLKLEKVLEFNPRSTLLAFHYIQQNNRIFKPTKVFSIRTLPTVNYVNHNNILLLDVENYYKQNYTLILCAGSNEQAIKLQTLLEGARIPSTICSRMTLCQERSVNIVTRKYPLDIILPEDKFAVISHSSIWGRPRKIKETISQNFFDGELPQEGDFVVHNFHGVGKCLGVKTLNISTAQRDYVVIEYRNGDKVYLPVENMNQLSKYIGSDKAPQINKIGGVEFAKTKEKVKSAIKKIAFDLIALYRERMNVKGIKYLPDDEMQTQFEKGFGFDETVDQINAIKDCKQDMESGKVMDRLVCGDVGFGKTEVALRIAFKTILAGKQVALLCPTTILSEQHFNTAKARMSSFGVKIDVLNRLRSKKDEERIRKDFSDGKIDMICGTHKLLSSQFDYKNLGLLVLDEEQKFGVADKEKIKNMKKHVNVLTLSATPIPRTLNMSLIGVRDISVIETPPVQRISSDVQVVEYNESLIKNAIDRELERGGQVLVIYNRVEKIYSFASKLKLLVPNAIISVAHGQMQDGELEKEIFSLYSGKTQVLVATTLIENGVDLPNANTLFVINADMLGLSQLYQLKGRIGRSDKSSFAYFMFDNRKILTDNACKRLQAIKEFSEMGSGFKIAMRDLEIRGAGSLLGAEQSGHIEKIGYYLYVDILSESVKELRGEKVKQITNIKVETPFSAYLSHDYVESSTSRMALYRQISNLQSIADFEKFVTTTTEIYGELPEELLRLCKIALIKNTLCRKGVARVVIKKNTKIYFEAKESLTKKLIDAIGEDSNVSLNLELMPVVEVVVPQNSDMFDYVLDFAMKI